MAYARKSVLTGRTVRSHLTGFGAFVGTGILALGVVAVPPDSHGARPEIRVVQLTASALPVVAYLQAAENFVSQRAQTLISAVKPVAGSGATNSGAAVTSPTVQSASPLIAAATAPQTAADPTVAATASALATPGFFPLAVLVAVVELALFVGPLVLGAFLLCPPCVVINELSYFIPGLALPFAAVSAASSVSAASVTAVAASTTTGEPTDAAPSADPGKADDVSPPATSTDKRTRTDAVNGKKPETTTTQLPTDTEAQTATETATKDATEAAGANEQTTEPTSARTAEPSPAPSSSAPEKAAVRGSHRGEGVHRTTGTVAAAEGSAATAGSSSSASSPAHSNAKGSGSASDDSSGADGASS